MTRWLNRSWNEVSMVMHSKFTATVTVLKIVSNEGDDMPPHIFFTEFKGQCNSSGVMVNKLDKQTFMSEFDSHWGPHS